MDLLMTLRLAWRTLQRNKLRSTLTMLGVIIGVGAVIATLAIGQGARASVQAQIASLGTNVVMVMGGSTSAGGARVFGLVQTLSADDADAIKRECPAVSAVSATARASSQIISNESNWSTQIQGVTQDWFAIRDWAIDKGALFTDADVRGNAKVCVLGASTANYLYPSGIDPTGQTVRIKNLPFRVTGVLAAKGGSAGGGQDQDDIVIAPLTTVQRKLTSTPNKVQMLLVSAASADQINEAIDQITQLLRQRHHIRPGQDDDFIIRSQSEFANAAEETSRTMTLLLTAIAAVSLLVGGIGIMNIMLVSVTERTREIGIRMAVGARAGDIRWQFLVESAFLSLVGGVMGIVLGSGASGLITKVARWPTIVSPASILLAFIFSAAIGIFFGYYPARKASRLDPIEALRYE
jgi:putative ABC transport system permease protein